MCFLMDNGCFLLGKYGGIYEICVLCIIVMRVNRGRVYENRLLNFRRVLVVFWRVFGGRFLEIFCWVCFLKVKIVMKL